MNQYEHALGVMKELFAKDVQFALATSVENIPSLRFVDAYFDGANFYVVTYATSQKIREIRANPNVALCSKKMYNFQGKAYLIGHPLLPENRAIREKLVQAFQPWYFKHNREEDEAMCFVRIQPSAGFFHQDGTGYRVDFIRREAIEFPLIFDTVILED